MNKIIFSENVVNPKKKMFHDLYENSNKTTNVYIVVVVVVVVSC